MIARSGLLALEIFVGLFVTLLLGVGFVTWRLSQGPIEAPPLQAHIERQLSAMRGGRPVSIERVELSWGGPEKGIQLTAYGVTARASDGAPLSRSSSVEIGLDPKRFLLGQFAVAVASFDGADVTIVSKRDGSAEIAFGPPGSPPDFSLPPPPPNETLAQRANRVLDGMADAFRPVGVGRALKRVEIRNAQLQSLDESGRIWKAESARLELVRAGETLNFTAEMDLEGARGPAPAALRVATDTNFQSALIELTVSGARPSAVFVTHPDSLLSQVDAPMQVALTVGLDRQKGITDAEGDVVLGAGAVTLGGERLKIGGARAHGRYDLASDSLLVEEVSLTGAARVRGSIVIQNASALLAQDPTKSADFNVSLPLLQIEAPKTLAGPVTFKKVQVAGRLRAADRTVEIDHAEAMVEEAKLTAAGEVTIGAAADGTAAIGLKAEAAIEGDIAARTVLAYWPLQLAPRSRSYVDRALLAGRLSDIAFKANIDPKNAGAPGLRNEDLALRFNFDGARFRYLVEADPLTAGRGSAQLLGNQFNLELAEGQSGPLKLTSGRVQIPQLRGDNVVAIYAGVASGAAIDMIDLLGRTVKGFSDSLPCEPSTVKGDGSVEFVIRHPLGEENPKLGFSVDGRLENVGAVLRQGRYTLADWDLRISGDERAVTLSGPLQLESSRATLTWTETLAAESNSPSVYVVSGVFDAKDLRRFGFGVAAYAEGAIGVDVRGAGRGLDVRQGTVALDLKGAAVYLPFAGWDKRPGKPANVRFDVTGAKDGGLRLTNLQARGPGMAVAGRLDLSGADVLQELELSRVWLEGRTDLRVTGKRGADGVIAITATGPSFDASPYISERGKEVASIAETLAEAARSAPSEAISLTLNTDRLLLKGETELRGAQITGDWRGAAMTLITVRGEAPGGKAVDLSIGQRGAERGPIRFRTDDFGYAYLGLTGLDSIRGGSAEASGEWSSGDGGVARLVLRGRDFEVVGLPAMARLLSSMGTLTGALELLNGDGLGFTYVEAPLVVTTEQVRIEEARASGPSVGITAKGTLALTNGEMALDGVIVPSYGLNSMLGGVPIFGQLLTSRRGEGVVGVVYVMNGPADAPRVYVNPLSALTPGILRRVLEPWGGGAQAAAKQAG